MTRYFVVVPDHQFEYYTKEFAERNLPAELVKRSDYDLKRVENPESFTAGEMDDVWMIITNALPDVKMAVAVSEFNDRYKSVVDIGKDLDDEARSIFGGGDFRSYVDHAYQLTKSEHVSTPRAHPQPRRKFPIPLKRR